MKLSAALSRSLFAGTAVHVGWNADREMSRDCAGSEQRMRRRDLGHWKSSPRNEISTGPRQLLQQIWIAKCDHDWLSAALRERADKFRERFRRARTGRIPALTDVRANNRYICRIGGGYQPRVVEGRILGRNELSAQFRQMLSCSELKALPADRSARRASVIDSTFAVSTISGI